MLTVILVDDNQTNLTLLTAMVNRVEGCRSISFMDPLQALAYVQDASNPVDMALVDYMMPELDGISFIQRLRRSAGRERIPVIMITADSEKEVRYRALQAGADDFLNKPVDVTELTARLTNMRQLRGYQIEMIDRASWLAAEVEKATKKLVEQESEIVYRLSRAAEYRDPETGAHILRMSAFSEIIARQIGLDDESCRLILEAAPMHDIGKVGIPDHILLKPAKLDDEEFALMKRHAEFGYEILKESDSRLLQVAADIALTHHEKYDGTGYPAGLAGEAIPLFGRIVAVADVFDALTSTRPYKKAWEVDAAVELLKQESGRHFDPLCVEAFLAQRPKVLYTMARYREEH